MDDFFVIADVVCDPADDQPLPDPDCPVDAERYGSESSDSQFTADAPFRPPRPFGELSSQDRSAMLAHLASSVPTNEDHNDPTYQAYCVIA
ncbi:hypothetical protein C8T65DRAFT_749842 [Cerioporus squamosus]|nr:hypothetical protein C8T65DRAFT_749842 [Cerioporus squamosus]